MTSTPDGEPQGGSRENTETGPGGAGVPPPYAGGRPQREQFTDLSRLRRVRYDKYIAGVGGGLARHFDIDPVIVRVALVVLAFFGGAGILIYGACWLLVPRDGEDDAPVNLEPRTRTAALYGAGALGVLLVLGDTVGGIGFPWPLAVVGLIVLLVVTRRERKAHQDLGQGWHSHAGFGQPGQPVPPWHHPEEPSASAQAGQAPAAPGRAAEDRQPPAAAGMPGMPGSGTVPPPPPPYAGAPVHPVHPVMPPPPPAPRNPRKRGPLLFWFTLALIALAEGTLGLFDVAVGGVPDPAYAALAVGITGAMLVLGAFWGRAGGLILVGLISVFALAASLVTQEFDGRGEHLEIAPATAAAVAPEYDFGAGELELDLRQVSDPEALDGRSIEIDGGVGRVEVIVPDGVSVDATAQVDGPGAAYVFGSERGGIDTTSQRTHDAGASAPTLTIDADLGVGEIAILHPADLDDYDWSNR
ncbi:PspC domain-containing protein [Nocardioides insulae]|uniref:PspC domain-containing protein n=1 Tax=Nocardioides insulae TaxID=394734 RepID=UPI0004179FE9|nr:PspC domain-containing protein [Nocardioides insulae]